jgi:membrane carboxypeptidase/penicillin-binding protein
MELGIIPKNPDEYIDLLDETIANEKKRITLNKMLQAKSITSCAYCYGLSLNTKRFAPAEQL